MMLGLTPDSHAPKVHTLLRIKPLADAALGRTSPLFDKIYGFVVRLSISPEHMLSSSVLMVFYSVRSECKFCEHLSFILLVKWFLGRNVQDESFHPTMFTNNRERLLKPDATRVLLREVVKEARHRRLLSPDQVTVEGALFEAWGSQKSYRLPD